MRYPYTVKTWQDTLLKLERESKNGFYFFNIRDSFGHSIYIGKVDEVAFIRIESHRSIDECYDSLIELLNGYPDFGYWYA